MTKSLEQAKARHAEQKAEALRMLALIQAQIEAPVVGQVHWGHVGDMSEVIKNLRNVGHYAGVPELTEK